MEFVLFLVAMAIGAYVFCLGVVRVNWPAMFIGIVTAVIFGYLAMDTVTESLGPSYSTED